MYRTPLAMWCSAALFRASFVLGVATACGCAHAPPERFEFAQPQLGTSFRIVLYAQGAPVAERAAQAAFAAVEAVNATFSDYDETSEARRATAGPAGSVVELGPELSAVLSYADELAQSTGGAFDVTVGPLVSVWRRAFRQEALPEPERLATARRAVGFELLEFDAGRSSLRLGATGMRLDFGGIAKGYALDRVLAVLAAHGIDAALVEGGGDVAVSGHPPGRDAWHVALEGSSDVAFLTSGAVATSGDTYRFFEFAGERYSHLIDPRTGNALTRRISVTVIAPSGMRADALASALSVLGAEAGLALVEGLEGVEARVVEGAGKTSRTRVSTGFEARLL